VPDDPRERRSEGGSADWAPSSSPAAPKPAPAPRRAPEPQERYYEEEPTPLLPERRTDWQELVAQVLHTLERLWHRLRSVIMRQLAAVKSKMRSSRLDRTVDSDRFDRQRAKDWQNFHDGKKSSSYLRDVDD
jgi:hypothetical protein